MRVFSWVISAMGRTKLTDTSNGYRAFRVSMLDDIAYRLVQPQYQTAELLIIAMKRGWRVTERPTVWLPRASGTTKKGKNWLFGLPLRAGRARDLAQGAKGAPTLLVRWRASVPAGLRLGLVVDRLQLRDERLGRRVHGRTRARPPPVRAGGGMAGPITT